MQSDSLKLPPIEPHGSGQLLQRPSVPMDLRRPYNHPAIRSKARAIMEDIVNWRACVNEVAERVGWNDPYVLDGLAQIAHFDGVYKHLMEQLAT